MRKNERTDVLRDMERRNAARAETARRNGDEVRSAKLQNRANRAATRLSLVTRRATA